MSFLSQLRISILVAVMALCQHYIPSPSCIFAELLLLRPLFLGGRVREPIQALQLDQLSK